MGANKHRGEIAVTLGGAEHVLRPDMEAVAAIDDQCGSIISLARRAIVEKSSLSFREVAIIICEGMKAQGRATDSIPLKGTKIDRVRELVFATGVIDVLPAVTAFLAASVTGGSEAKPGEAGAGTD